MFRTAITPTSFNATEWRDFDDHAEREDQPLRRARPEGR
jgi:hypothetical protein